MHARLVKASIKRCLIRVLCGSGLPLLHQSHSGRNQSVCNQPSCRSCQVILAVLEDSCVRVTAGRAACPGEPMAPRAFPLLGVEATSEDLMVVESVKRDQNFGPLRRSFMVMLARYGVRRITETPRICVHMYSAVKEVFSTVHPCIKH